MANLPPEALELLAKLRPTLPEEAATTFKEAVGDIWDTVANTAKSWLAIPTSANKIEGDLATQAAARTPGLESTYAQSNPLMLASKSRLILFPKDDAANSFQKIAQAIKKGQIDGPLVIPEEFRPHAEKHLVGSDVTIAKPSPVAPEFQTPSWAIPAATTTSAAPISQPVQDILSKLPIKDEYYYKLGQKRAVPEAPIAQSALTEQAFGTETSARTALSPAAESILQSLPAAPQPSARTDIFVNKPKISTIPAKAAEPLDAARTLDDLAGTARREGRGERLARRLEEASLARLREDTSIDASAQHITGIYDELSERAALNEDEAGRILGTGNSFKLHRVLPPIEGGTLTPAEVAQLTSEAADNAIDKSGLWDGKFSEYFNWRDIWRLDKEGSLARAAAWRMAKIHSILPERISRFNELSRRIYDRGIAFIDRVSGLSDDWSDRVTAILGPVDRDIRFKIIRAIETDGDNFDKGITGVASEVAKLSSAEQQIATAYRAFTDDAARYMGLLRTSRAEIGGLAGKPFKLQLPDGMNPRGRVESYQVVDEGAPGGLVTLRGLHPEAGKARWVQGDFQLPFRHVNPRYIPGYYHHYIPGAWFAINKNLMTSEDTASGSMLGFETPEAAKDWILRTAKWGPGGKTFLETFGKLDADGNIIWDKALHGELERLGIDIVPRNLMRTDEFRQVMSRQAAGALKNDIMQAGEAALRRIPGMPEDLRINGDAIWKDLMGTVKLIPALRSAPFLRQRSLNIAAYDQDVLGVMRSYGRQMVRKVEGDFWRQEHYDLIQQFKEQGRTPQHINDPNFWSVLKYENDWGQFIDSSRPSNAEELVKNVLGLATQGKDTYGLRRVISTASTVMSVLRIGAPISAFVNIGTGLVNLFAVVGSKATAQGFEALLKWGFRQPATIGNIPVGDLLDQMGVRARQFDKFAVDTMPPAWLKKTSFWALRLFNKSDDLIRGWSALSGYAQGIASGMDHAAAIEHAKQILDRTQFRYGSENMPAMLRAPQWRLLTQFKTWLMNETSFMSDLFSSGYVRGRVQQGSAAASAERMRFFTAMIASTGILGLPFVQKLDEMSLHYWNWSFLDEMQRKMPSRISKVSLRGLGSLMGLDLSYRIGFGGDIEQYFEPIFDPNAKFGDVARLGTWYGFTMDLMGAMKDFFQLRTEAAADRLAQVIIPQQAWYLFYAMKEATGKMGPLGIVEAPLALLTGMPINPSAKSGYVQAGSYYSARSGKPLAPAAELPGLPKGSQYVLSALGFPMLAKTEAGDAYERMQMRQEWLQRLNDSYMNRIIDAWARGDTGTANRLADEAQRRGLILTPGAMQSQFMNRRLTMLQRELKGAPPLLRAEDLWRAQQVQPDISPMGGGGGGGGY